MTAQHTPGPWHLKSWHEAQIVTRDGDLIAACYADKNRALIAAAPDLLAALQYAVEQLGQMRNKKLNFSLENAIATANKAIHKANGGAA